MKTASVLTQPVTRIEAALAEARAAVQAAIAAAEAEIATCREAAQHETAALEGIAARAAVMAGQVAQLEAGRFAGLEAAQAVLKECTATGNDSGAAAAAQEVARIEAEAVAIDAGLRPLRLQLAAVTDLQAAAEQRLARGAEQEVAALQRLGRAKTETLALRCDEAAIALRDALIDYGAAGGAWQSRIDFQIGLSRHLASALPGSAPMFVGGPALQGQVEAQRRNMVAERV